MARQTQNRTEMKKFVCLLCFSLQFLIWAASASRPTPSHHHLRSSAGEKTESPDAAAFSVSKIGSNPPRCADKCYGCKPCEPIEVPMTTDSNSNWRRRQHGGRGHHGSHSGIHVQYTIYEPEGWKCKCGPSLYSP